MYLLIFILGCLRAFTLRYTQSFLNRGCNVNDIIEDILYWQLFPEITHIFRNRAHHGKIHIDYSGDVSSILKNIVSFPFTIFQRVAFLVFHLLNPLSSYRWGKKEFLPPILGLTLDGWGVAAVTQQMNYLARALCNI